MLTAAPSIERLLYSRKEAAFLLSISTRTLDTYIAVGKLKVRKLGGRKLIPKAELVRFAARDQASPA
ncbi:helix-turn-helix domain-containing protein [Granulicella sp. dw_53]|uniref:helix-turn-helix domain-containing protein n=1 Tax=Granulicella sp. dw_53 TaxID=2719792 RepID=UPI001BD5C947|nr:helix-turn-helix domain-containing protein [Granulicella sp. dw_53]